MTFSGAQTTSIFLGGTENAFTYVVWDSTKAVPTKVKTLPVLTASS